MGEGSGSGFWGFIDIVEGFHGVPKILIFLGLTIFITGFLSGPFSLFHNQKMSAGACLICFGFGWKEWGEIRLHDPSPPYKPFWDFSSVFKALLWYSLAVWLLYLCYSTV